MSTKHTCPNCGNKNPKLIENNGERPTSEDFSLLCVKVIPIKDSSFDQDTLRRLGHVKNGTTKCGTQWEPNA